LRGDYTWGRIKPSFRQLYEEIISELGTEPLNLIFGEINMESIANKASIIADATK
jgi:hypothetical protein